LISNNLQFAAKRTNLLTKEITYCKKNPRSINEFQYVEKKMENYNLKNSPPTKKIKVNLLQALI